MARNFFITRVSADSEDPTALEFWPPKGSDELHEALKQAFPVETNLASRMRAAVIEFLLQEQQAQSVSSLSPEYLPSPQSSFISTMPSTPALPFIPMQSEVSQPRRQSSTNGGQQELMDVWALPDKPNAKIHTRRTMTHDEKKAYKQKRLVGACTDCKRRRRKCAHNPAVAGTSPPPRKAGKLKKRASGSQPAAPPAFESFPPTSGFSGQWTDSAWALDANMTAMSMSGAMDTQLPSFEMDFDLSPDLDTDWPLFPDSSDTFFNAAPTWYSTDNFFDTTVPSHNACLATGGMSDPNARHTPVTPTSDQAMSRSRSLNSEDQAGSQNKREALHAENSQGQDSGGQQLQRSDSQTTYSTEASDPMSQVSYGQQSDSHQQLENYHEAAGPLTSLRFSGVESLCPQSVSSSQSLLSLTSSSQASIALASLKPSRSSKEDGSQGYLSSSSQGRAQPEIVGGSDGTLQQQLVAAIGLGLPPRLAHPENADTPSDSSKPDETQSPRRQPGWEGDERLRIALHTHDQASTGSQGLQAANPSSLSPLAEISSDTTLGLTLASLATPTEAPSSDHSPDPRSLRSVTQGPLDVISGDESAPFSTTMAAIALMLLSVFCLRSFRQFFALALPVLVVAVSTASLPWQTTTPAPLQRKSAARVNQRSLTDKLRGFQSWIEARTEVVATSSPVLRW